MNPILAALQRRRPDDVVIEAQDGVLTARQLLAATEQLRCELLRAGIDRAGLLAGNSAAWVISDLASQAAGICLLPLPGFFAATQLRHSMQTAGIDAVLTDNPQRVIDIIGAQHARIDPDFKFELTLVHLTGQRKHALPKGTQKITFTSGSTGTPRGVCLGAEQQLRVALALDIALQIPAPRHLCLLPLSTLLENIGGVYYPLLAGGSLSLPPAAATGFSGGNGLDILSLCEALERHRPTSVILFPEMLVGLVAALESGWQPPAELQFAAVGGAKVAPDLIGRARAHGLPVYEGYGLSETASVACLNHPGMDRVGTVGRPLAHVNVSTESGAVLISGNSFLGYVDQPESWGKGQVATGDLGAFDAEGFLRIKGRSKNVLVSSFGRNVSPEWVESALLRHPEFAQCIVFGDARPYCTALVVPSDQAIDDSALQARLNDVNAALPDYARVVRWQRLPARLSHADGLYTENGRPRRQRIAARYAADIDALYEAAAVNPPRSAAPVRVASQ